MSYINNMQGLSYMEGTNSNMDNELYCKVIIELIADLVESKAYPPEVLAQIIRDKARSLKK